MKNKLILLICTLITGLSLSCSDDDEQAPAMDVDFQADVQNVSVGETVTFTDLSIGKASKWNWTFEGGTPPTSTLQNPTVTYAEPGTYGVTLQVSNEDNSAELKKDGFVVVAAAAVAADFKASKTNAIQAENVVFTDLSTGSPESWEWEFISGTGATLTSTEQNPIIAFDEPGIYSVKLTASNQDNSNQAIKADYITIIDKTSVEAAFEADQKNTYTGATVNFTDKSIGTATAWNWTFEGGTPATSTAQNPTVTYNTPGRYKVTLVASNDVKSSTKEETDYVLVIPGADLVAFYPLESSANDAGPNGLNPDNLGNVAFTGTDRNAIENATAVLDGASGLIVPDNAALNLGTSNFSIGVWVKTDQTSKMMIWQESGAGGPADKQSWLRIGDNTSDRMLRFDVEDSNGGAILNVGDADFSGGVSDGSWHHVVCVREGSITRVYIDGTFIKEMDKAPIRDISSEQAFKIGLQETEPGVYGAYFTGALDDLVVYNKALTATEVADLYSL